MLIFYKKGLTHKGYIKVFVFGELTRSSLFESKIYGVWAFAPCSRRKANKQQKMNVRPFLEKSHHSVNRHDCVLKEYVYH